MADAVTGAESATADPGVSLTDPVEVGDGINRDNQAAPVVVKPEPAKDGVDLKVWAKTSAENRQLKAQQAKLTADLEAATKLSTPEAINAAVLEALKKPETLKLLRQSGHTVDQIFDVYKEDDVAEDPKAVEQRKRIEALEEKLKLKEESETKAKTEAETKQTEEAIKVNLTRINAHVDQNTDSVNDEKDPRNGTPRWVLVANSEPLIREAHDAVVAFIVGNKIPDEKQREIGPKLLNQALDKIEIRERNKLKPQLEKIKKLEPQKPTVKDSKTKTVVDTDWRPKTTVPTLHLDRSAASGPAPVKQEKKKFSSGPRTVTFSS